MLFNSVLQPISTYLMFIFKLPTSICNDLGYVILNFLVGSFGEKTYGLIVVKKKGLGGLGFQQYLGILNQSLMAEASPKGALIGF